MTVVVLKFFTVRFQHFGLVTTFVYMNFWLYSFRLRVWGPILQDKRLLLQCDNSSSVILINTGRCRDKVMLGIVRNIWLLCSYFNIQIKAIHIQGIDNRVADLLSRWTEIRSPYEKITSLLDDCFIEEVQIASCMFDVDNSI
jgi:hypothetical protein